MPAEFWSDAARMGTALLLVAGAAVPAALIARARRPGPLLPAWRPWPVPWGGFEVFAGFAAVALVLPGVALELLSAGGFFQLVYGPGFPAAGAPDLPDDVRKGAHTVRALWANVCALPVALGAVWAAGRYLYPTRHPLGADRGSVPLAVAAWLVLAPLVLVLNAVTNAVAVGTGVTPDAHPLTRLADRPLLDRALFAFDATVGAAVREELLFRGLLLPWCVGRLRLPGARPSGARPWLVMAAAVALAVPLGERRAGPLAFAAALAVLLAVVWARAGAGGGGDRGAVRGRPLGRVAEPGPAVRARPRPRLARGAHERHPRAGARPRAVQRGVGGLRAARPVTGTRR